MIVVSHVPQRDLCIQFSGLGRKRDSFFLNVTIKLSKMRFISSNFKIINFSLPGPEAESRPTDCVVVTRSPQDGVWPPVDCQLSKPEGKCVRWSALIAVWNQNLNIKQTDWQIDSQTDSLTDRQIVRQTDWRIDR